MLSVAVNSMYLILVFSGDSYTNSLIGVLIDKIIESAL